MMNYCEDSKDKQSVKASTSDDSGSNKRNNISRVSSFASMPWFRLKDPRIVRVSRTFGGKDRHSKVCTIRGLRDRRVRLSVPTAIQLYDLQDRLGLSQPSKVVDWLLDAAKDEIDELPPLPMIHPVNMGQSQLLDISMSSSSTAPSSLDPDHNGSIRMKMNGDEEQQEQGSEDDHDQVEEEIIPPNNSLLLPRATHNNSFFFPHGSHYHLEPASVANLPSSQQLQVVEDPHNFSLVHHQLPSTFPLSQIQPNGSSNYFPFQYLRTSLVEMDPRHLQMGSGSQSCSLNSLAPLCSINHHQSGRIPFGFDVNATVASSHNSGNEPDKD